MPVAAYQGVFTSGASVIGFDVLDEGFGGSTQADATIRRVPWSQTGTVVVQSSGQQPRTRSYRALVYNWADFVLINDLVGRSGSLVVGAPEVRDNVSVAFLNSVEMGSVKTVNAGTPEQFTSVEFTLNFTFLA